MVIIEEHNTQELPRKQRIVKIIRANVYKEIDAVTFKYADAAGLESKRVENAISSDTQETLDAHLLARNIELRDARVRILLRDVLDDSVEQVQATDNLMLDPNIIYNLQLRISFKDSLLRALAIYIHRYLAWGALFDWYAAGIGSKQSKVFQDELDNLEGEILNIIYSDDTEQKPLQPFGPAKYPM